MEFKTINKHLENLVNALKEENEANTEMLDNFYTYLETEDKKPLILKALSRAVAVALASLATPWNEMVVPLILIE